MRWWGIWLPMTLVLGAGCPSTKQVKPTPKNYTIHQLRTMLKSQDVNQRRIAVRRIRVHGEGGRIAVKELKRLMIRDRNADIRKGAIEALVGVGPDGVPAWMVSLVSRDPIVRGIAKRALKQLRPQDAGSVAEVIRSPLPKVRGAAVSAFEKLGKEGAGGVPVLVRLLKHRDIEVRQAAADGLGYIGEAASASVGALSRALGENRRWWQVRAAIAKALGKIGPGAADASGLLGGLLVDKEPAVSQAALGALTKMGSSAIPGLSRVLPNQSVMVQVRVTRFLGSLGAQGQRGVPALMQMANEKDVEVRRAAVTSLGQIGPKAMQAIPVLVMIVTKQHERRSLIRESLHALVNMGPSGHEGILKALNHPEQWGQVAEALGEVGGKIGKKGLPLYTKMLRHPRWEVQLTSAILLRKLGKDAASAVPVLIQALASPRREVQKSVSKTLGGIGSKAASAVASLTKLTQSRDKGVREAAKAALDRVQGYR